MKKHLVFLLFSAFVTLLLVSCTKSADNKHFSYDGPCHCGVDNPLNDLDWLHQTVLLFESWRGEHAASIAVYTYDSVKQGFLINTCVQCDDGTVSLMDCEGNCIGMLGGIMGIPYSEYNIDPASVKTIYCNYPDTIPTLTDKKWHLQRFVDRTTSPWTEEVPENSNGPIPFWLQFYENGEVQGGGINHLQGNYFIDPDRTDHIYFHIESTTEIYDPSGWEESLIAALNGATICDFFDYGDRIRIYYDQNRKFLEFIQ